jgi:hypothetical protein
MKERLFPRARTGPAVRERRADDGILSLRAMTNGIVITTSRCFHSRDGGGVDGVRTGSGRVRIVAGA